MFTLVGPQVAQQPRNGKHVPVSGVGHVTCPVPQVRFLSYKPQERELARRGAAILPVLALMVKKPWGFPLVIR